MRANWPGTCPARPICSRSRFRCVSTKSWPARARTSRCKIYGDDFEELERSGRRVATCCAKCPAAASEFDAFGASPMLEIKPDRDALRRYNVHAGDLNHAIATALGGRGSRHASSKATAASPSSCASPKTRAQRCRYHETPARAHGRGRIAHARPGRKTFQMVEQVGAMHARTGQRRAGILVNLRGRDVEGFVKEAQGRIASEVKFPPGYYFEFGGQFENLRSAATARDCRAAGAGAHLRPHLPELRQLRQAALIFVCVPLAVTGGVFALWLRGHAVHHQRGRGLHRALSGIAVLNGIMLISFINQLRAKAATCAMPSSKARSRACARN
jgi:cobalt-zinc-cadmium resistance protein CzcA